MYCMADPFCCMVKLIQHGKAAVLQYKLNSENDLSESLMLTSNPVTLCTPLYPEN